MPTVRAEPEQRSVSSGQYETEVIETQEGLRALEGEWRQFLAAGVAGSSFFNDPQYMLAQLQLEPGITPFVLIVRRSGKIQCIAPFFQQESRLRIEFGVIKLPSPTVRSLTTCGGQFVVADEADARRSIPILFDCLWAHRSRFDLISFEYLPEATPLYRYCCEEPANRKRFRLFLASSRVDSIHQIHFPPTYDEFLASLSYETRRKLRRYTRRLQNTIPVQLDRIVDPERVPQFLDQMDQIYRDTWQASANGYTPRNTSAYAQYLSQISEAGYLRAYVLASDDKPIAFALGYQYDGAYYFLETGYAQSWADYGPGIVMMHLFFEDLCLHDRPKLLDFIGGDQPYKRSFSTVQHGAVSIYLVPPNRWRFVLSLQQLLHVLSRWTVRGLTAVKLDRAFRRLFKVHH